MWVLDVDGSLVVRPGTPLCPAVACVWLGAVGQGLLLSLPKLPLWGHQELATWGPDVPRTVCFPFQISGERGWPCCLSSLFPSVLLNIRQVQMHLGEQN